MPVPLTMNRNVDQVVKIMNGSIGLTAEFDPARISAGSESIPKPAVKAVKMADPVAPPTEKYAGMSQNADTATAKSVKKGIPRCRMSPFSRFTLHSVRETNIHLRKLSNLSASVILAVGNAPLAPCPPVRLNLDCLLDNVPRHKHGPPTDFLLGGIADERTVHGNQERLNGAPSFLYVTAGWPKNDPAIAYSWSSKLKISVCIRRE